MAMKHLQVSRLMGSRWIRARIGAYPPKSSRLAWVFEVTFARIRVAGWPEFLLQSLSILRVAVVNLGATCRWIRAATLSTNSWADGITIAWLSYDARRSRQLRGR